MFEFSLSDPQIWASLVTLTAMEIVLGIDNIVFISLVVQRLPEQMRQRARQIGIGLALLFRVVFLLSISWIISLKEPVITLFDQSFSWRDIILLAGGAFFLFKATREIHQTIEGEEPGLAKASGSNMFAVIIFQIVLIDIVFSVDSIITAVGMADHVEIMIVAVVISMVVMYLAAEGISAFIERNPTTKMLALAFLMLVGVALVADGFGQHIERGYIYSAMGFAALVETFNVMASRRKKALKEAS